MKYTHRINNMVPSMPENKNDGSGSVCAMRFGHRMNPQI